MLYRKSAPEGSIQRAKCGRVSFKFPAEYAWEISNRTLWRHTGKWRLFNARNWGSLKVSQFPEISLCILSTAFRVPLCDWLPVICVLLLGQLFCIYILFHDSRQFFRQVLPVFFFSARFQVVFSMLTYWTSSREATVSNNHSCLCNMKMRNSVSVISPPQAVSATLLAL